MGFGSAANLGDHDRFRLREQIIKLAAHDRLDSCLEGAVPPWMEALAAIFRVWLMTSLDRKAQASQHCGRIEPTGEAETRRALGLKAVAEQARIDIAPTAWCVALWTKPAPFGKLCGTSCNQARLFNKWAIFKSERKPGRVVDLNDRCHVENSACQSLALFRRHSAAVMASDRNILGITLLGHHLHDVMPPTLYIGQSVGGRQSRELPGNCTLAECPTLPRHGQIRTGRPGPILCEGAER